MLLDDRHVNWTDHGAVLDIRKVFNWSGGDANAAQCIYRNGKFYYYVSTGNTRGAGGVALGVAVSDSPFGPFRDALGHALVTNDQTKYARHGWDDLDPTVCSDDDGRFYRTAYSHPAVEGIIMWVFWAGNSWRGPNAGLARRAWSRNAAGKRHEALMAEWSTEASGVTDADGVFALRGFHGEYTVTVHNNSQQTTQKKFRLAPGKQALVVPVTVKVQTVR